MSSIQALISESKLRAVEIITGLVSEIKTVTNIPGYDYQLKVLKVTQEEQLVTSHHIYIQAKGQTLSDLRQDLLNKKILTVRDDIGRAAQPIRGKPEWEEKRNVFINHCNSYELYCKGRNEDKTECLAVFHEKDRKRFLLPMPHLGWRLAVMRFHGKNGHCYNFIFDGHPERPLVRPKTAPPSLTPSMPAAPDKRPKTASVITHYGLSTPSYLRVKARPVDYQLLSNMYKMPIIRHRWQ